MRKVNANTHETQVRPDDVPAATSSASHVPERRRPVLKLVMVGLAARWAADDERRRKAVLERRIAQVTRSFAAALHDGREVQAAFDGVLDAMTQEQQQAFLRGLLESADEALAAAGRMLVEVFTEATNTNTGRKARGRR